MRIVARRLDDQLIILRCLSCGHIEKCTNEEMLEKGGFMLGFDKKKPDKKNKKKKKK